MHMINFPNNSKFYIILYLSIKNLKRANMRKNLNENNSPKDYIDYS